MLLGEELRQGYRRSRLDHRQVQHTLINYSIYIPMYVPGTVLASAAISTVGTD